MTPEDRQRLQELARVYQRERHDCLHGQFGHGGGSLEDCPHPDCVLVRTGDVETPPAENRFRAALEQIVALDLKKDGQGRDDFYSGPDAFFRAWHIAREALGLSIGQVWASRITQSNEPELAVQGGAVETPAQEPLMFAQFSAANRERCESVQGFNHPLGGWDTSDWFLAVMGELGEGANVAKKLNRVRDGIPGNKETPEELRAKLRKECGDVFVYLDLLAQAHDFSIAEAAVEVFNLKSIEIGYPVQLRSAPSSPPSAIRLTESEIEELDERLANANPIYRRRVLAAVAVPQPAMLQRETIELVANSLDDVVALKGFAPSVNPERWARDLAMALRGVLTVPPPATEPQSWQPIDTVPTDWRWVLVWQEDAEYSIYRFGPGLIAEPDDVQWTHWMPLPSAPHGADTPAEEQA